MINSKKKPKKMPSSDKASQRNSTDQNKSAFPIVAIGASAGGLESFEKIFSHLPAIGMAYVVITHLDREHVSVLPELLGKYTSLPVVTIKDGTPVKPDTIYVIPPKTNIAITHGVLTFTEQEEPHYKNFPISVFFRSLAIDKGEQAIAIVLSGSGTDGSLGLRDIKEHGGICIVQDPATAAFDGMPRAALNTGSVDYVMRAEDISLQLKKFMDYGQISVGKISPELQQILRILHTHTGHDFSHYKLSTVCRRIEKQMYGNQIKTLAEYVRFLRINPLEVNNLLKDLLIGVTRFFRDPDTFDHLKYKILPPILKNFPKNHTFRVWIPGCSTGEEAYSIAMVLQECMSEMGKDFNVQIFATDIDLNALDIARSGIYSEIISTDMSPERLKRFFTKNLDHYKVKSEIRNKVIFGEQNIIKDPPFTKLDFISCRNLLIYLDSKLQKKVLPLFHYSLKPKGILFLGMSEAASGFTDYFELIAKKFKIFERKDAASLPRVMLGFDVIPRLDEVTVFPTFEKKEEGSKQSSNTQIIQEFILENYTAPCAVINKSGDIIYEHGGIEHYLRLPKQQTNLNIFQHSYPEIKVALLPVVHRVGLKKKEIICKNLAIKTPKKLVIINLHVIPITQIESLRDLMLIIFEDEKKNKTIEPSTSKAALKKSNKKLEDVVQELQYTRENLQATIEELEAGNEELQSANEELQSTNEEIETSKEELQSLNEELVVVNTELQAVIDRLAAVNDDMQNLFNSTEIAAFFLDNNLLIKRFTPKAQEFMHLIQADVGRSFSHFTSTIQSGNLVENAEEVLKTLVSKNYEVQGNDKSWYQIRILPYRTTTNMIDGVVIILTNISRFKEYESKLLRLNNALNDSLVYAESIINTVREPLLVVGANMKIITANNSFCHTFKLKESQVVGKFIYDLGDHFNIPSIRQLLEDSIANQKTFENILLECDLVELGFKEIILDARMIHRAETGEDLILLGLRPHLCQK